MLKETLRSVSEMLLIITSISSPTLYSIFSSSNSDLCTSPSIVSNNFTNTPNSATLIISTFTLFPTVN